MGWGWDLWTALENERFEGCLSRRNGREFHVKECTDFVQCGRADAPNLAQFFDRSKGSINAAVVIDPFGETRADAGNLFELGAIGAVQVCEGRLRGLRRLRADSVSITSERQKSKEQDDQDAQRRTACCAE